MFVCFGHWKAPVALLVLTLLLSACGRADQAAQQPSDAPLVPVATTAATANAAPLRVRPSPDALQSALTATSETIETNVAANRRQADAEVTATAAWAQTPEPTIVPPADGVRLREVWPASQPQLAAPGSLYLRSPSFSEWDTDRFWHVRLSDLQLRRLPVVEQFSVGDSALVAPDSRFLAYVTGKPPILRVFDLASDTDTGIDVPVSNGQDRCQRSIAWSPDGRTLAALTLLGPNNQPKPTWNTQLLLFDPRTRTTPQTLLHVPGLLELVRWLDNERLMVIHWSYKLVEPTRVLVVDRQGNQTLLHELEPGIPSCSSLSPDGRDLIYEQDYRIRRLQLPTAQEQPFSIHPSRFFWVGDGRTLLVSQFDQERRVWLRSLDQPEQEQRLFLSPPYQADYRFGITGISPDERWLVACEMPSGQNPRIRSSDARTWLYDIAQDRWTLIHTTPDWQCDRVVGWGTLAGAP